MSGWPQATLTGDPSVERTVLSCSWSVQLPAGPGLGRGRRTLRRKTHNIRRICTASSDRVRVALAARSSASVASCSWYSSSQVDLMLISRKRANSLDPDAPHPSTMLNAIDSADEIIWVLREPRSPRGNDRAARRTPKAKSCALAHTVSRRKSCTPTFSKLHPCGRPQSSAELTQSFLRPSTQGLALSTITDSLTTQHLDPLRPTSDPRHRIE